MPEIKLEHITKRWGKFYAVEDLNLTIADNSFVTLLGPSGCGKTTTLRMIAGLETPTSGRITIGDQVVFDSAMGINVPANKRRVGFLFQNYALWPNMTVYENISFGLTNVKEDLPKIDFDTRINARLAEILFAPGEVTKVLAECRDKKGKLDDKKALLKLIDTFTISQFTAKKLLGYHLEDGKDVSAEAAALREKAEAARKALEATGGSYDADYAIYKDGQPVTEVRKLTKEEIDLTVRRVARIVKIGMFMDRYPAELSGGQQQRVAIARTLAPEPSVLFMDEPLSNLDAKLRVQMRSEISSLHNRLGATIIYVTHDQTEAMTLGTRIVVLKDGVIMQVDSPQKLYNQPNNLFVAGFIGSPQMNFVDAQCVVEGAKAFLKFDKYQVELPEAKAKKLIDGGYAGKNVVFGIRPEDIYDSAEHLDKFASCKIDSDVTGYELLGAEVLLYFTVAGANMSARVDSDTPARYGDHIELAFDPHKIHVFDKETELTITN